MTIITTTYRCASGNHWWLNEADATKCCAGYKRRLWVQAPGESVPDYVDRTRNICGTLIGFYWEEVENTPAVQTA